MSLSLIPVLLILLILLWGIGCYNRFIRLHRLLGEAWSGISIQLKRRHDLIPNLVETVKGYATHEKGLLEDVTRLRASASAMDDKKASNDLVKSESALGSMIGKLMVVAENYPELKADKNFLDLQNSLKDIEDQLQMSRRYYNGCVRNYMIALESFPSLIVGRMFNFQSESYFELEDDAEKANPSISFS